MSDSELESNIDIDFDRPYSDVFEQNFPYYLAIGMTETQYWDGDCTLTRFYKKADNLRLERVNQELWLQGMYVYDAILRASPILHDFAKKGTKPVPYVEGAYPINQKQVEETKEKKEKVNSRKALQYMQAYMAMNNKRFKE